MQLSIRRRFSQGRLITPITRVETSQPHFSVSQAHPLPLPALALNASHFHPAYDVLTKAAVSQKPLMACQDIRDFIKQLKSENCRWCGKPLPFLRPPPVSVTLIISLLFLPQLILLTATLHRLI